MNVLCLGLSTHFLWHRIGFMSHSSRTKHFLMPHCTEALTKFPSVSFFFPMIVRYYSHLFNRFLSDGCFWIHVVRCPHVFTCISSSEIFYFTWHLLQSPSGSWSRIKTLSAVKSAPNHSFFQTSSYLRDTDYLTYLELISFFMLPVLYIVSGYSRSSLILKRVCWLSLCYFPLISF